MVKRIQFEVSDKEMIIFDKLMSDTGIRTKKDLINSALSFYIWAIEEKRSGKIIASIDPENKHMKEVILPHLLNL
ncbi:MAG: hypothetical protein GY737_10820 [Desulfobacteraceae bacterium]|nr:hypothetical protein [Desulfobacteraceae bacterium]